MNKDQKLLIYEACLGELVNTVRLHCREAYGRHPDLDDIFASMWSDIVEMLEKRNEV